MSLLKKRLKNCKRKLLINNFKIRYFFIALWNTIFGYLIGILFYNFLHNCLHIIIIGIIINFLTITMSFLTYKFFVFKSEGNWLKEYLKCFSVYSFIIMINLLLIWALVDYFRIAFWIAQIIVGFITTIFSYFGHLLFTFNKKL
jgi:putative flippase GtrA